MNDPKAENGGKIFGIGIISFMFSFFIDLLRTSDIARSSDRKFVITLFNRFKTTDHLWTTGINLDEVLETLEKAKNGLEPIAKAYPPIEPLDTPASSEEKLPLAGPRLRMRSSDPE